MTDESLIGHIEDILREQLISDTPANDTIKGIHTFVPPTNADAPYVILTIDSTDDEKDEIDGDGYEYLDVVLVASTYNETGTSVSGASSKTNILQATDAIRDVVEAENFEEVLRDRTGQTSLVLTNTSRKYGAGSRTATDQLQGMIILNLKYYKGKRDEI